MVQQYGVWKYWETIIDQGSVVHGSVLARFSQNDQDTEIDEFLIDRKSSWDPGDTRKVQGREQQYIDLQSVQTFSSGVWFDVIGQIEAHNNAI